MLYLALGKTGAWQEHTDRPLHMLENHARDWLLDAYLRSGRFEDSAHLMMAETLRTDYNGARSVTCRLGLDDFGTRGIA